MLKRWSVAPERLFTVALPILALMALATPGYAGTIASFTGGVTDVNNAGAIVGFSFNVSGTPGTSYSNLVMTLFETGTGTNPVAAGIGYLESSAYTGLVTGLPSTSYIGTGTANAGTYVFNSNVTVVAGVQYWFYQDTTTPPSLGIGTPGGQTLYLATPTEFSDGTVNGDSVDFALTETPSATPEPSTGALGVMMCAFLAGVSLFRRRSTPTARP